MIVRARAVPQGTLSNGRSNGKSRNGSMTRKKGAFLPGFLSN